MGTGQDTLMGMGQGTTMGTGQGTTMGDGAGHHDGDGTGHHDGDSTPWRGQGRAPRWGQDKIGGARARSHLPTAGRHGGGTSGAAGPWLSPVPFQYYCCKKDESEEDEEEPDFAVHSHIPPLHCNRNVVLTNGPSLYASSPFGKKPTPSRSGCPGCGQYEPPTFFLQEPPEELHNGGDRVSFQTVSQEDLELPVSVGNLQALNPNRLSAMREAFSRSRSISTDV